MALNWTITVGSPVLTQGMSFQVKYRKLPSTTWVPFLPNPTTNVFTIPNLDDDGQYEAEIRTVCSNGELSQPVYHTNSLTPPSVILRWNDNQGNEERTCSLNSCTANIEIVTDDPDNAISKVDIYKSTDNGTTWSILFANYTSNTFSNDVTSLGSNKYKAIVTDLTGVTYESNILTYKGSTTVQIVKNPDVFITIYKPDSGSHFIGQVKFYGLQANTVDGSNIVKVEMFVRFRAIGENWWWQTTETHIVVSPSPSIALNRQFVYGFRDNSKYIGTRDWNGADSVYIEFRIHTSSGDVNLLKIYTASFPWFSDYNQAIV
jgi:hypothetical protein